MRLATMIISLVLTLIVWVQSCAGVVGGGFAEGFSQSASEKAESREMSEAGSVGLVAGVFWVIGAGLVMTRPGIARWFYLAAAPVFLIAGGAGYDDAYIWAVVSLIFMAMAWRGVKERENAQAKTQEAQYAQFQQWQQWQQAQQGGEAMQPPPPGSPPPQQGSPPPQ